MMTTKLLSINTYTCVKIYQSRFWKSRYIVQRAFDDCTKINSIDLNINVSFILYV